MLAKKKRDSNKRHKPKQKTREKLELTLAKIQELSKEAEDCFSSINKEKKEE